MTTEIRASYSPSRSHLYCPPPHGVREYSPVHRGMVREMSRSPVRNEFHTAAPIVEKVFEKSMVVGTVANEEARTHTAQLCAEATDMRIRMMEHSNLVDQLRAL